MPKVSVYLPDELYAAVRAHGLSVSALAQDAIRDALRVAGTDRWIAEQRARPARVDRMIDTVSALHDAREAFGV